MTTISTKNLFLCSLVIMGIVSIFGIVALTFGINSQNHRPDISIENKNDNNNRNEVIVRPHQDSNQEPGEITVRNNSRQTGQNWWDWTVYLDAAPQTLSQINCVDYNLHETFDPNFQFTDKPVRPTYRVCNSQNNFAYSSGGYGAFDIRIRVLFKDGSFRNLPAYWLQGVGQ